MTRVKVKDPAPKSNWREHAKCKGEDVNLFFPERGKSVIPAKTICHSCTVKKPCLEESFVNYDPGIWGEKSERERKAMRRY